MRNYDTDFLKRFSMVIGMLALVTILLLGGAALLHSQRATEPNPAAEAKIAERLQPVGAVYAGESGAAALAAAAEEARAAASANVPFGGSTDGKTIYDGLCSACHGSGVAGAPKLVKADWDARLAQGNDTLIRHAIEGFQGSTGVMPPRGGNPALTDEQVASTVRWMLDQLQ